MSSRLSKRAISVTLSPDNLIWLQARAILDRHRSVSRTLDQLIREARLARGPARDRAPSVAGTITIGPSDPDLRGADASVRELFRRSLQRRWPDRVAEGKPRRAKTRAARSPLG